MSNWSATNQRSNSPTSAYHIQHSNTASTLPFSNTTNPNSRRYQNSTEPFSSFPSSSGQVIDQVDECCSYIDKLLINEAPSLHQRNRSQRHSSAVTDTRNSYQKYAPSSSSKPGTMTIGHHHYNNRHHYSYHDHYHDDSPLLPRIEFPSGQFDRLLRGSPNLDRSSESSNRYTSSSRDTSSSASLSSSSSTSASSPFSSSNSSSSRLSSWKSGPFDSSRKK